MTTIQAPEADIAIGIEHYATSTPGCDGILRSTPEDFFVEEIYEERGYEGGKYLILSVEKRNWDTHHLIRELSRQLKISQKRVSFAGTKDKKAVTRQRLCISGLKPEEIDKIHLADVRLNVLGSTNRSIGLGDLLGNRFKITIRNLTCPDSEGTFSKISEEISRLRGVPNYFGVQRFGDTRPVTHLVGEALVKGDTEGAVMTYLAKPFPGELEATRSAREALREAGDFKGALKSFPRYLHYEIAMLNYLVEHPGDFAGSFDVLAPSLKHLFVHAYQSYLFNRILSSRLSFGLPLNRAMEGDVVCFSKGDLPDISKLQVVTADNLDAINRLMEHGRAHITLPLLGYESRIGPGPEGDIERSVLEDEGLGAAAPSRLEGFRVPKNTELGSKGLRRSVLLRVSPRYVVRTDFAELEFFLPAGSYATVVLREFMKSGSLITDQRS